MTFTITPTTPDDIRSFFPAASPWRVRALTVRVEDEIVGIGGLAMLPTGDRIGFMEASEDACKSYPVIMYRATRKFFAEIEAAGVRRVVASEDSTREAAGRWLERLGFAPVGEVEGERVWQWQR